MKKVIILMLFLTFNLSETFADDSRDFVKLSLNQNSSEPKTTFRRFYTGGDIGATFGDYSQIVISPMIGYRISKEISTGLQFIYNHSWQTINKDMQNQSTLQSNTVGGNIFFQYNPISSFYLRGEFEYDSYSNYQTTQNTTINQAVPFIYLGAGYSTAISKSASFNAGIKVDVLNNENSPYFNNFTPVLYVGIGVGI